MPPWASAPRVPTMTIAARLVPVASRSPKPNQKISSGTITVPPPTPNKPLKAPAAVPIAASRSSSFRPAATFGSGMRRYYGWMAGDSPNLARATRQDLLAALRAAPERTAILTDFDGTLAPIVERAEDAALPSRAREVL